MNATTKTTPLTVGLIGGDINRIHPGRESDGEITLFDGTGVGLQDLAVATAAAKLATANGSAIKIDSW